MPAAISIINRKFGKLTVIEEAPSKLRANGRPVRQSICECECGTTRVVLNQRLLDGHTQSCGCQRALSNTRHGHAKRPEHGGKTRTYFLWKNLRHRASIWAAWEDSYSEFLSDVGEIPDWAYTLDLIDVKIGYEPGNVRWATQKEYNATLVKGRLLKMVGLKFGRLTVVDLADRTKGKNGYHVSRVRCRCECGKIKDFSVAHLNSGGSASCGCQRGNELRHGHARRGKISPTYWSWSAMMGRCYRQSHRHYKHYGARGIKVCERWRAFENLLADLGERPEGQTLHRPNNDGNYSCGKCAECVEHSWPLNAQWATDAEQSAEKSNRHYAQARVASQIVIERQTVEIPPPIKETGTPFSRTYNTWRNMMLRCHDAKHPRYSDYGARGITVCKRWHDFKKFRADMGDRPSHLTLERLDNNNGYSNENCAYVTRLAQSQNKRNVSRYTVRGFTGTFKTICDHFGVPYGRARYRLRILLWDADTAVFAPHTFQK